MHSKFEDKLFNYQAEPPAGTWDAIATALDTTPADYAERLHRYQQIPNNRVWEKINNHLDAAPLAQAQVVPINKYKKTLRYAAAAIFIVCIASAGYFFNNSQTTTAGIVKADNANLLKTIKAAVPIQPAAATPAKEEILSSPIDIKTTRPQHIATASKPAPLFKKIVAAKQSYVSLPKKEITLKETVVVPPAKPFINTAAADRYMVATSASGNTVRLPKKVYSAFACADEATSMHTKACLDNLALLQHKMSATLATDFAGFLDLLKNLQENSK